MNQKEVEKILESLEVGYDQIAVPKFSGTRKYLWRDLEFIQDYVKNGDKVLDFGCGNGRLAGFLKGKISSYVGIDVSEQLIQLARSVNSDDNSASFQKIDRSGRVPFPDSFFNTTFSIAVFHHLPGKKYRLEAAKELFRVTNPGGFCMVTAWNLWQKKYQWYIWKNAWDVICRKSLLDFGDVFIPFRINSEKGEPFMRYHHAFTPREMSKLMIKAGFKVEKCEIVSERNIVCIARRIG